MCGIYGITEHNPKFIEKYIETCRHRGPDGSHIWATDKVTLGHNLLSIMADPEQSQQPWTTPKGNMLVYNGEIFNYHELKEKHHEFVDTSSCDTELLAWGLDKHGLDFIDELDSMHGFAYYDKEKNTIILSRDHAGIKPLYYAEINEGLIFGSEIKGMLDKVPGSRTLNKLAVSFQSRTGINPIRQTLFSGIKKLLPGETIVYDIENKKITDSKRIYIRPNSNSTFNEKEFREQLNQAVKRCSIGQRKIGVFLSGGLDSSVVAHELMKVHGSVNSFTNRISPTVEADENYNSDAEAAKVLANKEGYNHTEVNITPGTFVDAWDDSIYFMELPSNNPSMSMYCHTNKVLAQNDIVVTMAGDMGDEILCGYPKYEKMFREVTPSSWKDLLKLWMNRMKRPLKLTEDILPDGTMLEELANCYSEELWNPQDPVASYMALDCVTQVPEEFFSRNDKYGMAYSMEGRFPLASKKFMQYCLNIPTSQKLGKGKNDTKLLTKLAYKNILPDEIINKEKTGWTVPVGYWLVNKIDSRLQNFYKSIMGSETLDSVKASQKVGKTLIPAWVLKEWRTKYHIK